MAVSLPTNPDLERFRTDARRLQRAVRAGDPDATALVRRLHPDGLPADRSTFPLASAQLVVARRYGFASWPRLRHYLLLAAPISRDVEKLEADSPADRLVDLACLRYAADDDPSRWAQAAAALSAEPSLTAQDISVAAVAADLDAMRRHLDSDPGAVSREVGPFRWPPLLSLVYSRMPQRDPIGTARLLLDRGADPAAGYLWGGLPTPFTALTGCFGEGEQGPGRQPRHPQGDALARLLLDRGADANDGQALYNRMFGRDDSHLELLFEYGLGTGDGGVWRRRLGDATESPAQMMDRQVTWAQDHGFAGRLALLAAHGFGSGAAAASPTDIHRAGSPEGVAAATAAGADVDAYESGRTALHHQAWIGDVEMVTALLAAGADPDLLDETYGTTPLGWAEYARQPETAALLSTVTRDGGTSPSAGR